MLEEGEGGRRSSRNSDTKSSAHSASVSSRSRVSRLSARGNDHVLRQSIRETIEYERQEEEKRKRNAVPCRIQVPRYIVENPAFVTLTTLLTVYALIGDDIRLIYTNKSYDALFDLFTCVCLGVFSIELVLSSIGKQDYMFGFFFWLDFISTITLILDITIISDLFVSDEESFEGMKNSKTARGAAKAARVVRVLRLVRILKLYKALLEARAARAKQMNREHDDDDWEDEDDQTEVAQEMATESNVGKKLSDLTTRKCVILILAMMLTYPQLKPDPEDLLPMSQEYAANAVHNSFVDMLGEDDLRWIYEEALLRQVYYHNWFAEDPEGCGDVTVCPSTYKLPLFWFGISSADEDLLQKYVKKAQITGSAVLSWEEGIRSLMKTGTLILNYGFMPEVVRKMLGSSWNEECRSGTKNRRGVSLLGKHLPGIVDHVVKCPEDLRSVERTFRTAKVITKGQFSSWYFAFYFDKRQLVGEESLSNLITTAFVCLILCGASAMFAHDAQELVLKPVETMMLKVHMIRINPLIAAKLTDEAFKHEEMMKSKSKKLAQSPMRMRLRRCLNILMCTGSKSGPTRPMETAILEATIIKLGTLLALGFGNAGMNIISHNMQGQESAGVDAMVAGTTVDCIIGFARLGEFSTFTEVLQTRVMTFVNQVAEIIHGVTDGFQGAPSRATGDSFLNVWTLREDDACMIHKLADMALMSCSLILAGINTSATLAAYRTHPGLQQRLRANTRVTLSFGLHFGWAIEGALGTEYKIDASYVSPNVSIAENVERAAELYGTNVVLTEAVHELISADMLPLCRLIDRVQVRGSRTPMSLYSVDLYYEALDVETNIHHRWNVRQRFRARQFLEAEKTARLQDSFKLFILFETNRDLAAMRAPYTVEFREVFGMGYQNYSLGEWPAAQRLLRRAKDLLGFEDGPIEALLRYMQAPFMFRAPDWWKGFHSLEDMPSRKSKTQALAGCTGPAVCTAVVSSDIVLASMEILDEEPAGIHRKLR